MTATRDRTSLAVVGFHRSPLRSTLPSYRALASADETTYF